MYSNIFLCSIFYSTALSFCFIIFCGGQDQYLHPLLYKQDLQKLSQQKSCQRISPPNHIQKTFSPEALGDKKTDQMG